MLFVTFVVNNCFKSKKFCYVLKLGDKINYTFDQCRLEDKENDYTTFCKQLMKIIA